MKKTNYPIHMTEENNINYENETHCWLCLQEFKNKLNINENLSDCEKLTDKELENKYNNSKVRDHDHL